MKVVCGLWFVVCCLIEKKDEGRQEKKPES